MTGLKRRHPLHRPWDRREIIIVHGDECFDSLMPAYRGLCNEYNLNACEVADLAQLGKTPEEILNVIGARRYPFSIHAAMAS
jgi:hypothetical protein